MFAIDFSLSDRLPESRQARRTCSSVITQILCCAKLSRSEGLLEIENFDPVFSPAIDSPELRTFFKTGMGWAVDGINEEDLNRFFTAVLSSKKRTGSELLSFLLVAEGILSIRRGEHPAILSELLFCWVGIDLEDEIEKVKMEVVKEVRAWQNRKNKSFLKTYCMQHGNLGSTALDKLIRGLDPIAVGRVIRDGDERLQKALLTCHSQTIQVVLNQMTSRLKEEYLNSMRRLYTDHSLNQWEKEVECTIAMIEKIQGS